MVEYSVSVIIPAKNEALLIGDCIDHVKASIEKWNGEAEIIVIDNGSTDSTVDIAKSKGVNVFVEKEGTIAHMRNFGARKAIGNVLAFLDADCMVSPLWIVYCLEALNNPQVAGVGTRAIPDLQNATWVEKSITLLMAGAERPDFVKWLGTLNLFVKTDVFWSVDGFDEELITCEDYNLCTKINKQYIFFLEKRIDTIHMRESKTLKDLYKREFWRGKSSLSSYKKNNYSINELPSILIPLIITFCFLLIIILYVQNSKLIYMPTIVIFLMPVALIFKKLKFNILEKFNIRIYIVAFMFIIARSFAIIFEIIDLMNLQIKKLKN